jgi:hypothetical protein
MPYVKDEGSTEQQDELIDVFADDAESVMLAPKDEVVPDTAEEEVPSDEEDDKIPAKFRGKSLEEIVESYSNLERAYGQRSNDYGELRRTVDQLIAQQLGSATSKSGEEEEEEAADVKARTEIDSIKSQLAERTRNEQKAEFLRQHPDAEKIVRDPRFNSWMNKSATRVKLFQKADAEYDYALAGELLDLYKEVHKGVAEATEDQREKKVQALKGAKPNAGGAPVQKRKVYKSSDLMKLKDRDPDRYTRMQPEILSAYAEGRVLRDA